MPGGCPGAGREGRREAEAGGLVGKEGVGDEGRLGRLMTGR